MIDIDRGIFLPQNILMSILSVKIHSLITITKTFAFINIMLMSFFAQKIMKALSMGKKYRILAAFLFSINPIYMYFYLTCLVE